jgi:hypothetical protein
MRTAIVKLPDPFPALCDIGTAPLIFDIVGPFVVQFRQGDKCSPGSAIICAPLCVDHHANILTDSDDISLCGLSSPVATSNRGKGYVYKFAGGTEPTGASSFAPPKSKAILRVKYQPRLKYGLQASAIATKCHFAMVVPVPNEVVPLRPEWIWMHRNYASQDSWVIDKDNAEYPHQQDSKKDPDNIVHSLRGRGLRLIYHECKKHPKFTTADYPAKGDTTDFSGLCAKTQGFPVGSGAGKLSPYYYITLRFGALHATSDGLEDAHSCFQTMRALFDTSDASSEFSRWRVDFAHPPVAVSQLDSLTGQRPRDCGAAVLAMQDWDDDTTGSK